MNEIIYKAIVESDKVEKKARDLIHHLDYCLECFAGVKCWKRETLIGTLEVSLDKYRSLSEKIKMIHKEDFNEKKGEEKE